MGRLRLSVEKWINASSIVTGLSVKGQAGFPSGTTIRCHGSDSTCTNMTASHIMDYGPPGMGFSLLTLIGKQLILVFLQDMPLLLSHQPTILLGQLLCVNLAQVGDIIILDLHKFTNFIFYFNSWNSLPSNGVYARSIKWLKFFVWHAISLLIYVLFVFIYTAIAIVVSCIWSGIQAVPLYPVH